MNTMPTVEEEVDEMKKLSDDFFSVIPGIENAAPVPVLDASTLTEEVFRKHWVTPNKACLIKGAVKEWPARQLWGNKEYWLSKCDNFEVSVYPHRNFNDPALQNTGQERMLFHDAIERLFQKDDHTFSMPSEQIADGSRFFRVTKDLGAFPFLPSPKMPMWYSHRRFFTYRRAATAWHFHGVDETLMCQIKGSKKVALLPPDIPRAKYVTKFLQKELHLAGQKINESLNLNPMIVLVEEGDALYIPPYWHHAVVPADSEIGFTLAYCWGSPVHKLGNVSNYFVRDLYREGLWPLSKYTFLLPLLGLFASGSFVANKIAGRI